MKYSVELSRKAEKDLDQLDRMMEKQVREKIKKLSLNPLSHELSQKVKMGSGERKTRVGDWRIFFEVDEVIRKIVILAIRHRSRAY